MNIKDHFLSANVSLDMAKEKVQRNDFEGARACLAQAEIHTTELLDHIRKLEILKADVELSPSKDQE